MRRTSVAENAGACAILPSHFMRKNNNGKGGETPLKNSVKQNGNENKKEDGTVQQSEKGEEK